MHQLLMRIFTVGFEEIIMSAMGAIVFEMQELIVEGFSDVQIANTLSIPVDWVQAERKLMENY